MAQTSRLTGVVCLLAGLLSGYPFIAAAAETPQFSLPVDCIIGETCFLQSYMDIDPGPGRRDPFCGTATYDGHKGTDIRVRDVAEMQAGVPVLAMADGRVTGSRNTASDRLVETDADRSAVKGRECGNGVVIDHGDGWVTQLCHLARGSLRVRTGDTVKRGETIGRIGLSGLTQFPHVHASVRKDGEEIDPMTMARPGDPCGETGQSLWTQEAAQQLRGDTTVLLRAGYAASPVTGTDVVKNRVSAPSADGPLILFAHFINLQAGDVIELEIVGPNGVYARGASEPLPGPKASYTAYAGKRGGLPRGAEFNGIIRLLRDGQVVEERTGIDIRF